MPPVKRAKIAEPVLGDHRDDLLVVVLLFCPPTPHGQARTDLGSLPFVDGQARKRTSGEAAGGRHRA